MKVFISILAVCCVVIALSSAFILTEIEQCVVTRLGKIVRTHREPGLKFKIPLIEEKHVYSKQILNIDESADKINTMDKKYLLINSFSKWRISDPVKFKNNLISVDNARIKVNTIIQSDLREKLGKFTLNDIITSEKLEIMRSVVESVNEKVGDYGVEVVDVRIKGADLPKDNQEAVFNRMRAERKQQANQYRSEGEEEARKIRAEADKEKEILLAESYKKAQMIRGEGDAKAAEITANAYRRDADFYSFIKSLETYRKVIDTATTIVLPADQGFLKGLQETP